MIIRMQFYSFLVWGINSTVVGRVYDEFLLKRRICYRTFSRSLPFDPGLPASYQIGISTSKDRYTGRAAAIDYIPTHILDCCVGVDS